MRWRRSNLQLPIFVDRRAGRSRQVRSFWLRHARIRQLLPGLARCQCSPGYLVTESEITDDPPGGPGLSHGSCRCRGIVAYGQLRHRRCLVWRRAACLAIWERGGIADKHCVVLFYLDASIVNLAMAHINVDLDEGLHRRV